MEKVNIVNFYSGVSVDSEGRTINDILEFNYEQLEVIHNYIQWLFPLNEKSNFNFHAPILTLEDICIMKANTEIKNNINKAISLILDFYGLRIVIKGENIEIIENKIYASRVKNWITPFNHNYLRITRMLKFLVLSGMKNYAVAFYNILERIYDNNKEIIGKETFQYWKNTII
jgi:hypothetical protein